MKTFLKGPKGRFLFGSAADFKRDQLGFYESCAREYGDLVQTLRKAGLDYGARFQCIDRNVAVIAPHAFGEAPGP